MSADEEARPNFSGVWSLNIAKSTLRTETPKRILVKIEHHEPHIKQSVLVTSADDQERRMAFTFTNAFPSYRFERGTHLRHRRRPPDPAFESAICCPRLRGRNDHRERPAPLRGRDRYRRQAPVAEGCGSAVVLAATGALTLWAT